MKRNRVPMLVLDPARESLVSSSGGVLLRQTIELAGLARALTKALSPWRSPQATHDPGKVLLDVATAVALGGDCLVHRGQSRITRILNFHRRNTLTGRHSARPAEG